MSRNQLGRSNTSDDGTVRTKMWYVSVDRHNKTNVTPSASDCRISILRAWFVGRFFSKNLFNLDAMPLTGTPNGLKLAENERESPVDLTPSQELHTTFGTTTQPSQESPSPAPPSSTGPDSSGTRNPPMLSPTTPGSDQTKSSSPSTFSGGLVLAHRRPANLPSLLCLSASRLSGT